MGLSGVRIQHNRIMRSPEEVIRTLSLFYQGTVCTLAQFIDISTGAKGKT